MTRRVVAVPGILLLLLGVVWTGQGAGLIRGSFMTGSGFWLAVGIVCLLVGAALTAYALRRKPTRTD